MSTEFMPSVLDYCFSPGRRPCRPNLCHPFARLTCQAGSDCCLSWWGSSGSRGSWGRNWTAIGRNWTAIVEDGIELLLDGIELLLLLLLLFAAIELQSNCCCYCYSFWIAFVSCSLLFRVRCCLTSLLLDLVQFFLSAFNCSDVTSSRLFVFWFKY
jgi:hypothetical protein